MKKILIFIDWYLPGYKAGGPISSNANLIQHLSDEFQFYIITRDTDYCENRQYTDIISDKWNVIPGGANVYYISSKHLGLKKIKEIISSVEFEVVYINGIYSFYFSLFPLIYFKYFTHRKIVVAARGMLSDHTFSSKKGKKKMFYLLSRILGLYNGITFHATNDDEAQQIKKNVGFKGIIKIAPNLPPKIKVTHKISHKESGELKLISIARISQEKNTLFALQILEEIGKSKDAFKIYFDLYGIIYDQNYWNKCKEIINRLPPNIAVKYCGSIEKEKISEYLMQYHFLFMPSMGENYGHSIVESLIAGCPVIISDKTPWKNLYPNAGWDLSLENMDSFVKAIEECVGMDNETYQALAEKTIKFADNAINIKELIEVNKHLFE